MMFNNYLNNKPNLKTRTNWKVNSTEMKKKWRMLLNFNRSKFYFTETKNSEKFSVHDVILLSNLSSVRNFYLFTSSRIYISFLAPFQTKYCIKSQLAYRPPDIPVHWMCYLLSLFKISDVPAYIISCTVNSVEIPTFLNQYIKIMSS